MAPWYVRVDVISHLSVPAFDEALYEALPETLQSYFTEMTDNRYDSTVYELGSISIQDLDILLEERGIKWDREASLQRLRDDKSTYPLNQIEYSDAEVLIDIDSLGITNNKRVLAVSVFGDVSGFTAYIDKAEDRDAVKTALRVLHAIRKEMASIVKRDFNGVRIQFQGDRVQALFHLPKSDDAHIAAQAVDTPIALQSSMEIVIKKLLPEAAELGMSTGDLRALLGSCKIFMRRFDSDLRRPNFPSKVNNLSILWCLRRLPNTRLFLS